MNDREVCTIAGLVLTLGMAIRCVSSVRARGTSYTASVTTGVMMEVRGIRVTILGCELCMPRGRSSDYCFSAPRAWG
jgi:hypothetical protein